MRKRMPSAPVGVSVGDPRAVGAGQTGKTLSVTAYAPHPHRNLGAHLKTPKDGEYVTEHHRGAKRKAGG